MINNSEELILSYIHNKDNVSSSDIYEALSNEMSQSTVKRALIKLLAEGKIISEGNRKSTRYSYSKKYAILSPINVEEYFSHEIDERTVRQGFNFDLIENVLKNITLFTDEENRKLNILQEQFTKNIAELSLSEYEKEMERLGIDLSWKSSQIEGNTYSLLETERLLKDKKTAAGKTKEEAIMLLNHKEALKFILSQPDYLEHLTVSRIEDIHSILIQELNVERNIRKRRVGITGTNYRPIDNQFQIKDAMQQTCDLINSRSNVFEKSLYAILLLSYIQPFVDGNKRTARIVGNSLLIANKYCPLSFRTVDSIDYKKAMLLFYEQNNIYAFKNIFIDQYEFAVNNYF